LAQMRSADWVRKCLLFGVDRTYYGRRETDAIDPLLTSPLWDPGQAHALKKALAFGEVSRIVA
jgi:hypothetical protein